MGIARKAFLIVAGITFLAGCAQANTDTPKKSIPAPVTSVSEDPALAALPARLAPDGVTIEVGNPTAKNTVTIYEDFRCPYCVKFEKANAAVLAQAAAAGHIKIHYIFASFLDGKFGGGGSMRAAHAVRASVDAGAFPVYHRLLYANQPPKAEDGFTTDRLLHLAATIPALRVPSFTDAVQSATHADWVAKAQAAYATAQQTHPNGVPTVLINDTDANAALYDTAAFTTLLHQATGV